MWVINILLSEVAGNSNVSVFVRLLKKMSTYFRSLLEVLNIVLNIGTILREKEKRNSSIENLDFFFRLYSHSTASAVVVHNIFTPHLRFNPQRLKQR